MTKQLLIGDFPSFSPHLRIPQPIWNTRLSARKRERERFKNRRGLPTTTTLISSTTTTTTISKRERELEATPPTRRGGGIEKLNWKSSATKIMKLHVQIITTTLTTITTSITTTWSYCVNINIIFASTKNKYKTFHKS